MFMVSLVQAFHDNVEKHSVLEDSLLPNKKSDSVNRLQYYANYFRKHVSLQFLKEKMKYVFSKLCKLRFWIHHASYLMQTS